MRRADIAAFVHRDWSAVGRAKDDYWREHKKRYGALGSITAAFELYLSYRAVRPDGGADRKADLLNHARLAEIFSRVGRSSAS
ncbi:MAG: hypothetical protein IT381_04460 [Deltaproteobacteria bacterium]|nr:hypothetical protein [Deltaproteobacteria bacterium]